MRWAGRSLEALASLAAVALCVVVFWPQGDGRAAASPELALATSGGMKLWNSKAGEPLVGSPRWRPAKRVSGRVAVENRGAGPVVVRLSARRFREQGVALSRRMRIRVRRTGTRVRPAEEKVVYKGNLRNLTDARIARLRPGGTRRYWVTARLDPRAGNQYQGSWLRFGLRWRAASR